MRGNYEYGDYQTPLGFAETVCRYLRDVRGVKPSAVVEPTCGTGNFLKSALMLDAEEYYGVEMNPNYCQICENEIPDSRVTIIRSDIFSFSSRPLIKNPSRVLILGNPPWATNSALSVLDSDNLPEKSNFKGLNGLEALTGASNFDICEAIILRLIHEYRDSNALFALLCKRSVARNVFQELKRSRIRFSSCDTLEFDASKVFGISAEACVWTLQLSENPHSPDAYCVYDLERPLEIKEQIRLSGGRFFRSGAAENFDGRCRFPWRQGVKHDCAKVMELSLSDGVLRNGQREEVRIEPDLIFPLAKSSSFKVPIIRKFSKYVIVTQTKMREDTRRLESDFPKTWEYLNRHKALFERRKSAIYRGAPPFSMFGVGEYSYARYKVGISGFYKTPLFSLLHSDDGKPVMTDDTAYFLRFESYDMAYTAMLLLNSDQVQNFLEGIAFPDAKRPYTKKVLQRIDFGKIVRRLSLDELRRTERKFDLPAYVSNFTYDNFKALATRNGADAKRGWDYGSDGIACEMSGEQTPLRNADPENVRRRLGSDLGVCGQ